MNDFIGSNGWALDTASRVIRDTNKVVRALLGDGQILTAIEYGRHLERTERDKKLGRERVAGYPDFAIYPAKVGIWVLDEQRPGLVGFSETPPADCQDPVREAARVWFESRSPAWVDAKDGEIWELDGHQYLAEGGRFFRLPLLLPADPNWRPAGFASDFRVGARIYPSAEMVAEQ